MWAVEVTISLGTQYCRKKSLQSVINMERRRCCVTSQSRDDIVSRDLFHFPLDKSGGCTGLLKNIGTVFILLFLYVRRHRVHLQLRYCRLHPAEFTAALYFM